MFALIRSRGAARQANVGAAVRRWQQPCAAFHQGFPTHEEKKEEKDISPAGIDRTNPLYAPSWRREWKHYGYTNIAQPKDGEYWKEWEDLPAPYKYYHVKVDPADVENKGMLWKLATNWKTAIPLSLGLAIPLFAFDVVMMDSHMELAAIFWASIAMVQYNFGDAIRNNIAEENDDIKKELLNAETEYFDALESNVDVHQKAIDLPKYVRMINEGDRALRHVEAAAATRQLHISETNRMVEMLDYLVMISSSGKAEAGDDMIVSAQSTAEKKLSEDNKAQQQSIADAISALKKNGVPLAGNTTEKLFKDAMSEYQANPPKPDAKQQEAEEQREREIFNKRFGFVDRQVTDKMLSNAQENEASMAILKGKTGGAEPEVGANLVNPNPINYMK